MKTLGDNFVAQLHAKHLKSLGFKKTRHTFVRAHGPGKRLEQSRRGMDLLLELWHQFRRLATAQA